MHAFLGICEAIFRGRDLIFCGQPEAWRPAYLFLVLLPPILDPRRPEAGSRLSILKNDFIAVILIWGFPQNIRSLPLKMASHIMISLRMHNCIKSTPPLELNWRFQAPKVRGFFRHKFLSFMKCFQIFINVNLPFFKKTKF